MKERQSKNQFNSNNISEGNISNEEPIDKIIRTSKPKSQQSY